MKHAAAFLMLLALLGLAACENPENYPISGEQCGPEDPVLELDSASCLPPV